ncbi:CIA30 family protein [Christiangramia sediminis]|uniref:CIA30 family protein n=1 Tax=Christiangramia sediminis TaxID=2881336 RepID=A0A9X1RV17_9FLAO|nr:CIA30 family protein [Christiangramia sediminis]MCB7480873.1 CIA30 family protein [Christiangramia sediminis]
MKTIFDFQVGKDISNWYLVEDRVMGGESDGKFFLTEEEHAQLEGMVSLDNNGGFVSVKFDMPKMEIEEHPFVSIRLKGDGKEYQFRIKNRYQYFYSSITEFSTNSKWQEIKIP